MHAPGSPPPSSRTRRGTGTPSPAQLRLRASGLLEARARGGLPVGTPPAFEGANAAAAAAAAAATAAAAAAAGAESSAGGPQAFPPHSGGGSRSRPRRPEDLVQHSASERRAQRRGPRGGGGGGRSGGAAPATSPPPPTGRLFPAAAADGGDGHGDGAAPAVRVRLALSPRSGRVRCSLEVAGAGPAEPGADGGAGGAAAAPPPAAPPPPPAADGDGGLSELLAACCSLRADPPQPAAAAAATEAEAEAEAEAQPHSARLARLRLVRPCPAHQALSYLGFCDGLLEHMRAAGRGTLSTAAACRWLLSPAAAAGRLAARLEEAHGVPFERLQIDYVVAAKWGGHDHPYNYFVMPDALNASFGSDITAEKVAYIGRKVARCVAHFAAFAREHSAANLNSFADRVVNFL